jgi:histone deacetylase 6
MEEGDYVMGEDEVMDSTEMNGVHSVDTVDPSMITLARSPQTPFRVRKAQPPILESREEELEQTATRRSSPQVRQEPSTSSLHGMGSDEMDVTYSRPARVEVRIPPPPRFPPLPYSSSKTGLVYDARMRFHCEPLTSMMRPDDIHPEDPRRIHEIFQEIQQAGLVQGPSESEDDAKDEQCWRIHPRAATKGEVCLIHTPEHWDFIESLQGRLSRAGRDRCMLIKTNSRKVRARAQRTFQRLGFDILP